MTFSAGPKTGDHRLVEEKRIPSITDILIDQAGKMKKVCQKFFRLNADGTTICEDDTGKAVASTMDLKTLTTVSYHYYITRNTCMQHPLALVSKGLYFPNMKYFEIVVIFTLSIFLQKNVKIMKK
jgi:hypothetical protein